MSNLLSTINFFSLVQDQIGMVESLMRSQADSHHPDLKSALNQLLSSGGKRIRPGVVLLTGGMLGGDVERLVTLSSAIELLHTATLVHDDLIDGAFLRRGMATLNSQWSPAATVLTGDFVFAKAARLAADTNNLELMSMFAETLATIVNGEITQLFTSHGVANRQNYMQRIYAKTASLFELCTTAAAMISAVDNQVKENARAFGYSIGIAFQIVDDVLDFTAQANVVGKPVASDLRQGLITLPALYYLDEFPDDPVIGLMQNGLTPVSTDIDRLVESIRTSGSIEKAMQDARQNVQTALKSLNLLPANAYREALEALAYYIVDREL